MSKCSSSTAYICTIFLWPQECRSRNRWLWNHICCQCVCTRWAWCNSASKPTRISIDVCSKSEQENLKNAWRINLGRLYCGYWMGNWFCVGDRPLSHIVVAVLFLFIASFGRAWGSTNWSRSENRRASVFYSLIAMIIVSVIYVTQFPDTMAQRASVLIGLWIAGFCILVFRWNKSKVADP